jgi:hypothetical protein
VVLRPELEEVRRLVAAVAVWTVALALAQAAYLAARARRALLQGRSPAGPALLTDFLGLPLTTTAVAYYQ